MPDHVTPEQRSKMMAAVGRAHTSPELYVRKHLFAEGFRYRLHSSGLAGKPDIVLPRFRTAVFVHGCFWHGHHCRRGRRPSSNTEFWNAKIDANMKRDRRNKVALRKAGWDAIVIWQCRLEADTRALIARLRAATARV